MTLSSALPIRILIVDDHVVVRTALRAVIEGQANLTMVGEAGNRKEALEIAEREKPNVILLDLDLGGESGLDLISDLQNVANEARVVVLTGVRDQQIHQQAVSLGELGIVQ